MPSSVAPPSPSWSQAAKNRVLNAEEPRGSLEIFMPAGKLIVTRARGHLSRAMALSWIETIEPHFKTGAGFHTFHDWADLESYESSARQALTDWVVASARTKLSADFLVGSKIVAMGISAATVATAFVGLTMKSHLQRSKFEEALRVALEAEKKPSRQP